jgi:hypothetical protein
VIRIVFFELPVNRCAFVSIYLSWLLVLQAVDTFTLPNDCQAAELKALPHTLTGMKAYSTSKMASGNINVMSNLIIHFMTLFLPLSVRRKGSCVCIYSVLKPFVTTRPF